MRIIYLAYRPALSAADLIEYAGYAWGWFVAAGGMAAVGAIAHGAAEKLGENVSEAAWKRLTKVFSGSPFEPPAQGAASDVAKEMESANAAAHQLLASYPEVSKEFLRAGEAAALARLQQDGFPESIAKDLAHFISSEVESSTLKNDRK